MGQIWGSRATPMETEHGELLGMGALGKQVPLYRTWLTPLVQGRESRGKDPEHQAYSRYVGERKGSAASGVPKARTISGMGSFPFLHLPIHLQGQVWPFLFEGVQDGCPVLVSAYGAESSSPTSRWVLPTPGSPGHNSQARACSPLPLQGRSLPGGRAVAPGPGRQRS